MIATVKIPKISANVGEVTVTRWLKQEREPIARGEALAELTTDKAAFDLEAPAGGVVRKILAREQSVLPVGYVIALVGSAEDALPNVDAANRRALAMHRGEDAARPPPPNPARKKTARSGTVRATPAARRLARKNGVDLQAVAAAIHGGIVNEKAVRDHLDEPAEELHS